MARPSHKEAGWHETTPHKKNDEQENKRRCRGHKYPVEAGWTHWEQKFRDVKVEGFTQWQEGSNLE